MRITLADELVFNADTPDSEGRFWYVTDWEGWDSPEQRQSVVEPSSRHGVVVAQALLGARPLVLRGICKAPNEASLWRAWNRLMFLTNNLYYTRSLVVDEGGTEKELRVVRAQPPRLTLRVSHFEFEIPLSAPDPLKYAVDPISTVVGVGATVGLTNVGTFATDKITATVSADGRVILDNLGASMTLTTNKRGVENGTVFDFHDKTVQKDGDNVYDSLTKASRWWSLLPGLTYVKNRGTTPVTISHRPAWV